MHFYAAATGFHARTLRAREDAHAASAGFRNDFAVGLAHFNGTAAGVQSQFATHGPNLYGAATGFGVCAGADVVEFQAPASAFGFHSPSQAGCINIAALGFDFCQCNLARNVDGELARKMPRPVPSLPIAYDPRGVAFHISAYLELVELAASFFFRRIIESRMNHIMNALLLPATYHNRAHIHFHS